MLFSLLGTLACVCISSVRREGGAEDSCTSLSLNCLRCIRKNTVGCVRFLSYFYKAGNVSIHSCSVNLWWHVLHPYWYEMSFYKRLKLAGLLLWVNIVVWVCPLLSSVFALFIALIKLSILLFSALFNCWCTLWLSHLQKFNTVSQKYKKIENVAYYIYVFPHQVQLDADTSHLFVWAANLDIALLDSPFASEHCSPLRISWLCIDSK